MLRTLELICRSGELCLEYQTKMSRRKETVPRQSKRCGVKRIHERVDHPRSWRELLACYDLEHARNEEAETTWFATQPSLPIAIEVAAAAQDHRGKRYDHQWRIRRTAMVEARRRLIAAQANIASVRSFSELLALFERLLLPIPGIGEMYCYDSAARIGSHLSICPDRVYLHRGTRVGARALNLPHTRPWLLFSELPEQLRNRSAREVENIFCIYAEDFRYLV
jgi:hypothetical protein